MIVYNVPRPAAVEPTLNELVSLRDALTDSLDDIIGIDRRLHDIQPSNPPAPMPKVHQRTGKVERGIRPRGKKKATPRSPSSDRVMPRTALGRSNIMEAIEVDGYLKGHRDYPALLAASPSEHAADWDAFVLPEEFFRWHDHIVVDERSALGDGSESDDPSFCPAAQSPVQDDFPQQGDPYSYPRPPPAAPPGFINTETHLWKCWPSYLVNWPLEPFSKTVLGDFLVIPGTVDARVDKAQLESVDPWDVSSNQDPPFYRAAFMTPPYISGMPTRSIWGT